MIYTVTFNPSLDYIVSVDDFKLGLTNRTSSELMLPGGKGINVSTVLMNLGIENTALGFTAGFVGEEIIRRLQEMGVKSEFIQISEGVSRINLKLKSIDGTEINGAGPVISKDKVEELMKKLEELGEGDVLFLAGSIPSSMPDDMYQKIMAKLDGKGVMIVVDATRDLLLNVLEYHPFLIKPNNHELGEIFDVELLTRESVVPYAKKLQEKGARNVLVSMAGEADQEDNEEFKDFPLDRTLKGKKTYQKIIIMLAGVFMNFMLALVIMLSANLTGGQINVNHCEVGSLVENGSATKYGFKKGDVITNIECKQTGVSYAVASYEDLHNDMTKKALKIESKNATLDITVRRGKDSIVIKTVTPYNEEQGRYVLGFMQVTRRMSVTEALSYTSKQLCEMSTAIFSALGQLVVNFAATIKQLSGPVGIYKVTSQVRESGSITTLLYLVAMLSVNIGILNLLPIPGLDGYQAILSLIEGIIHREVPGKVKYALQVLGFALVFGLMIAVTYQDLLRLFQ